MSMRSDEKEKMRLDGMRIEYKSVRRRWQNARVSKERKNRSRVWLHENGVWYNSLHMWSDVVDFSYIASSCSSRGTRWSRSTKELN